MEYSPSRFHGVFEIDITKRVVDEAPTGSFFDFGNFEFELCDILSCVALNRHYGSVNRQAIKNTATEK